ncbi:WPP domain-interacting tail-anchored protein 2 [Citrus sinensis]|uniref:WPP domain-interacting tail-anchored protein 2 isoform X2 n=1 Tax=Citrus sinensis TaxID=2711 RepID=UPI0003D78BF4|nr:WPP domain-interacting tail-anchored protein 2 isoform X2 [Citrus sinensis]KAH9707768.1 WPP domain-interacting tail-anchored protein 2 [Citrus sinensis]
MGMNEQAVDDTCIGNPEPDKGCLHEVTLSSGIDMQEKQIDCTMTVLTRVDLDLAYSSEKLVNLHVLLMYLLARGDDLETLVMENSDVSATSIEKALVYDLLFGILDSELREVERLLDTIHVEIVDVHHKISSCKHLREVFTIMEKMEKKLHDCEGSLKESQEHVSELKMQSAKFQRVLSYFIHGDNDEALEFSANGQLSNINGKSKMKNADQQRHILRMLEKSLARELDLEKKISELNQNEEQLKLKLHHTEQVAFRMEEAAEVVWGRFLEAENSAEVLMGISKEMLGRFQIVQFNLNGSLQRESELKSKLGDFIEQLKAKDMVLQKLESTKNSDVLTLKEKVKSLEEQLKESEIRLQNANACFQTSQEQLNEMDNFIESLKESLYGAESRAESAEEKVTQLTDTNLELSEEINFLKGNNDSNTKKVGILENQLRDLEIQLQQAKVSSEASQEQQSMLYSAIWDMETLIEDLKSKVSKAESKTESVEEQCIVLSEDNFELKNEQSFMRDKIKILESSLNRANNEKTASAKEVNHRTKLMMEMVMQLATQRELIQKQVYSLTSENKLLVEKLQYSGKSSSATMYNAGDTDDKELLINPTNNLAGATVKTSEDAVSLMKSVQEDEVGEVVTTCKNEPGPSIAAINTKGKVPNSETLRVQDAGLRNRKHVFVAVFVVLLSVAAIYLFN